jgi:predicted ATP-dependent endonuclease of OLD family
MNLNENKEGKLELSYLWLGDNCTSNIKNQGFNFSTDLEFEFIENKLSIRYKNKFINNFYGKNIINISAIVGENGSGKTSIINFLKDCSFENSHLKEIVIFKKSNEIHIFNTINLNENNICNNTNYNFILHDLLENKVQNEFNKLGKKSIIFYSDIFNCRRGNLSKNESGTRKRYNISTDYLIVLDKDNQLSNGMNIDQVENFNVSDIFRKLNFILDKSEILEENKIITPSIKYIKICINDEGDWLESRLNNLNSENPFTPLINQFSKLLNLLNSENSIKEKTNHYFKLSIIFYIFFNLANDLEKRPIDKLTKREKEKKEWSNNIKESLQRYDKNCEASTKIKDINLNNYCYITKNIFKQFIEDGIRYANICNFTDVLDIFKGKWIEQNNTKKLILKVNINNEKLLKKFLNMYIKSNVLSLFKIKWIQEVEQESMALSSGEEAMLKIYSRFYSMINDIDINIDGNPLKNRLKDDEKNLLILLDEPELYLHPEWQRKLLSRLVEFYEVIFKEKNIQIILTSNTPFVISDIPKDNIIFMKKNNVNNLCEVISKHKIGVETFGANIHTLLTNSFFMENTIGEFANQKIKNCIKIMDKYKQSIGEKISKEEFKEEYIKYMDCKENEEVNIEEMKKKIKYIIDIIGEPLIKRKLEEIYRTIFFEDTKDYELEIKKLQKEKAQLQEIIKNKGTDNIEGIMALLNDKIRELKNKADGKGDIIKMQ